MKSQIKIGLVFLFINILLFLLLLINLIIYVIGSLFINGLLILSLYVYIQENKNIEISKKDFNEKNKDKKFLYLNKEDLKTLKKQGVLIKDGETIYKENIQEWQIKN